MKFGSKKCSWPKKIPNLYVLFRPVTFLFPLKTFLCSLLCCRIICLCLVSSVWRFAHKNDLRSSLFSVICRRVHVAIFVFVCVKRCPKCCHIILPVPIDCPFFIVSFVFSNDYFKVFGFQIFWFWAYMIKITSETGRAH